MSYKKTTIFFVLFFLNITILSVNVCAQAAFTLKGRVADFFDASSLELATVFVEETGQWAVTDKQGHFTIQPMYKGNYTLEFSYSGYQRVKKQIEITNSDLSIIIALKVLNLSLEEVVIVAKRQKLITSSKIEKIAIQHLQPKSISDLLQLVPGNITENPNLSRPGQIKIREISVDNNSALGAAIIVDGVPLSTNANLQVVSTAKSGTGNKAPTVAGRGIDLRDITTENIESIEVIRGIPSVEYGNLTSGAVIVKTKSGKTPLETKVSIDPNTKLFYIGKGVLLPNEKGTIFSNLDYTRAYSDKRKKYQGYERITGGIGYSNTFFKNTTPFLINAKSSFFKTIDDYKSDAQLKSEEVINSGKMGIRFGLNGKWYLNRFINNLSYKFSGSYTHQKDYIKDLKTVTAGTMPLGTSYKNGENTADFIPSEYYSELTIEGKPFSFFSQLTATANVPIGKSFNVFKFGLEWSAQGNKGEGKQFNINYPPTINSVSTLRPRAFKDIPNLNKFSLFFEDQFKVNLKSTALKIAAGVRMAYIPLSKSLYPKGLYTIEPRINSSYQLLNSDNNLLFDDVSIRFGYGIAYKSPTILHLYPDKAYFDESSFNYYDGNSGSLAVLTTKIIENTSNPKLKPIRNQKKEIGLDIALKKIKGSITAYYEKQTQGLGFSSTPVFLKHRDYTVKGSGKKPFLKSDGVYYYEGNSVVKAAYALDTAFHFYKKPINNYQLIKKGIEYNINFGKIDFLKTSIIVDGAWFYTKKETTKSRQKRIYTPYNGKKFPYIAVMPSGEIITRERLNTNIRAITHIPDIKMVVSLVTQIIWFNKMQYRYEDEHRNSLVFVTVNNKKIDVDNAYSYIGDNIIKNVAPTGYIDKAGKYHNFNTDSYSKPPFYSMLSSYYDKYFLQEVLPPVLLFNLKLTKELSDKLNISFAANNFLNIRPYHKLKRSSGYIKRNISLYFGAEIKLNL